MSNTANAAVTPEFWTEASSHCALSGAGLSHLALCSSSRVLLPSAALWWPPLFPLLSWAS